MKLTPMANSDRAWCYSALDYSEEEMHAENLAVKFKNAERAQAFQVVFKKCVVEVKAVPPPKGNLLMLFVDTFLAVL